MKKLLRRLATVAGLLALAAGFYLTGRSYLWPARDRRAIAAVGMIEATEVNITSRIAGRIAQLSLIEGDSVEKGEVVCRIEDVDLRNQLHQAEAELQRSRVQRLDAARTARRIAQLFKEGVASVQQNDDAATQLLQSQAAVVSGEANVQFYRDQVRDTRIVAPIDGVVVSKALEVGEWVTPGTPILTVDDLSNIWARVDVQETRLRDIRVGAPALISIATTPPTVYAGRVMTIGQEGQFATERDVRRGRQDVRTFYVKVRVLQNGGELKPGMTAEVRFAERDGLQPRSNRRSTPQ